MDATLSVFNLVIIFYKGEENIPELTDTPVPQCWGPKIASSIRKLFNSLKKMMSSNMLSDAHKQRLRSQGSKLL